MGKVLGIVCEYNPFHNGHLYHLEQAKKVTGSNYSVAILSGNFTQRGSAAIVDKWSRTEMALKCGIDLVIELPVLYATSSAENFADGAIRILDALKVVDYIAFGSEDSDIDILDDIAKVLHEEPKLYKSLLVGNEVQRFGTLYTSALTGDNTVFTLQDFYLEAIKYIGVDRSKSTFSISKLGKTFASTQFGEKKVFLMACRQFRLQYGYSEYSVENLFSYAFVEEIIGGQADNIKDSILQILVSNANYSYSEDEESQNVSYSLMKNYLDGDSQQQTNLTLPFVSNVYDLSDVSLFPTDNSYFINSMIFKGVTNQDSIEISSFYMSFSCDNIDSIINNYTFLVKYCTYGLFGMSSVEMFLLDMNEDTISNLEVGLLYFEFEDLIRLNNNGDVNSIQDRDPIILNTATKDGSIPTFNNNVLNYADEFNVSKTWGTYGNGCLYNSKKEKNDYFEIIMLSSLYVPISIEMIYF